MAMLLMALAGFVVVRLVHAMADADGGDQVQASPAEAPQASGDVMVGLAGFEPTTP